MEDFPAGRKRSFRPVRRQIRPEALHAALLQLERGIPRGHGRPPVFNAELSELLADYTGRPSPITEANGFSQHAARTASGQLPIIVLKREDLNHTGSHKINNVLGQALLTRRMGKTRVIAETGAGQHGVATATAAALFGLDCRVYMGKVDTERQALNVARMRLLGAEVVAVESGTQTLKDAMNEAMRDWVASVDVTHYLIGSVAGPHPFPKLVREFQRVISTEARAQLLDRYGRLPDAVAACVGGAPTRSASSPTSSTTRRSGCTASRRAARASRPGGTQRPSPPARSACCTGCGPSSSRTRTARPRTPTRSPPGSTIPASARSTPGWLRSAAPSTARSPTPRRWRPSGCCPRPRASFRPSSPPTRLPGPSPSARNCRLVPTGEPPLILVNLSGRGDKDVDTAIRWFGIDTTGTDSTESSRAARTGAGPSSEQRPRAHRSDDRTGPGSGRGALVGYLQVGYPTVEISLQALRALTGDGQSPGVDLVEVGMPYSDPVMDGVTIQRAGTRALRARGTDPGCVRRCGGRGRHRYAGGGDDLLEPDRALRADAFRP